MVEKVVIMGAAGRDFHNFNVYFRENPRYRVVAFTAAQIPSIETRKYPPELSGIAYPEGIPIYPEEKFNPSHPEAPCGPGGFLLQRCSP